LERGKIWEGKEDGDRMGKRGRRTRMRVGLWVSLRPWPGRIQSHCKPFDIHMCSAGNEILME